MKILIDRTLCVGAGRCLRTAPSVFDQSPDDGLVVLIQQDVEEQQRGKVNAAIHGCPAQAISLANDSRSNNLTS